MEINYSPTMSEMNTGMLVREPILIAQIFIVWNPPKSHVDLEDVHILHILAFDPCILSNGGIGKKINDDGPSSSLK
jgi:hypothetical protein